MKTTNSAGHYITLGNDEKITFHLSTQRLINAINTCDLGVGNIYSPIIADSFVSFQNDHNDKFHAGETIQLEIEPSDSSLAEICILSCNFSKVGKEYNGAGMVTLNPWGDIFVIEPSDNMIVLSDGSLRINGKDGNFSVTVATGKTVIPEIIHYVSYSILFYLKIDNKLWYCIIDPLLRISSNPPPI